MLFDRQALCNFISFTKYVLPSYKFLVHHVNLIKKFKADKIGFLSRSTQNLIFRVGGKPGVYTNVAEHVEWIREMIKDTSDDGDNDQTSDDNRISSPSDVKSDLTSAASEEETSSNGAGGLKCRASNGKLCKFPFEFRGKVSLKFN